MLKNRAMLMVLLIPFDFLLLLGLTRLGAAQDTKQIRLITAPQLNATLGAYLLRWRIMSERLIHPPLTIFGCLLLTMVAFVSGQPRTPYTAVADEFHTRCGWLSNPTPANTWLYDRYGEWIIGRQGGYQMEGDWELPDFKPRQWVVTNTASYGYGCACLRLRVNKKSHEVLEIESSSARPLAACRRDRSLRRWGFK